MFTQPHVNQKCHRNLARAVHLTIVVDEEMSYNLYNIGHVVGTPYDAEKDER